ncbi:chromate transporter [Bordetella genomosp. 8]|uniref:Chromate transporter n=1 Tax=Bordetella genomosp. 8 TaxID=1416806 RepID=A0A1W6YKW8_9BORD|nr:chromate efflux transporter [Bordetella genomosp. 8]ARP81668.1 chromate transporter [Bordetella genomosp. 8]
MPAWIEVFLLFLRLGLTSFGGPVAHLGYFRGEFVERRKWLDEHAYSDIVALSQFLPGPASSKVGMTIGLMRAGWAGMLAAWVAFTLPSALLLIVFGLGLSRYGGLAGSGAVHGLKIVAVAIVAQAVWGMARSLCPDRPRAMLAIAATLLTLLLPTAWSQVGAIVACGLVGAVLLRVPPRPLPAAMTLNIGTRTGAVAIVLFFLLLAGLPLVAELTGQAGLAQFAGFYRSGALVFGGGHVVLPLLQSTAVGGGMVSNADFLAGYGAAQAVPGPLFTFAAFLGTVSNGPLSGWAGGFTMLLAIFLPAALLVVAALPFWHLLRTRPGIQNTVAGINAGVVGILLSALYNPVWTSAIGSPADFGLALLCFALLTVMRWPPLLIVAIAAAGGWFMAAIG